MCLATRRDNNPRYEAALNAAPSPWCEGGMDVSRRLWTRRDIITSAAARSPSGAIPTCRSKFAVALPLSSWRKGPSQTTPCRDSTHENGWREGLT